MATARRSPQLPAPMCLSLPHQMLPLLMSLLPQDRRRSWSVHHRRCGCAQWPRQTATTAESSQRCDRRDQQQPLGTSTRRRSDLRVRRRALHRFRSLDRYRRDRGSGRRSVVRRTLRSPRSCRSQPHPPKLPGHRQRQRRFG